MKINEIRDLMQQDKMEEALVEIEKLIEIHDDCPFLWVLRGDLIQSLPTKDGPSLEEAGRSYLMALRFNPNDLEAIESLANFYDCIEDKPTEAKKYAAAYIERATKSLQAMERIINGL
jgi:tetratricopeptide (TPR) repeat protein